MNNLLFLYILWVVTVLFLLSLRRIWIIISTKHAGSPPVRTDSVPCDQHHPPAHIDVVFFLWAEVLRSTVLATFKRAMWRRCETQSLRRARPRTSLFYKWRFYLWPLSPPPPHRHWQPPVLTRPGNQGHPDTWDNVSGYRWHHAKWGKSDRERPTLRDLTYM